MVSGIERGTRSPRKEHAEALDSVLEANGALVRLWSELADSRDVPEWFRDHLMLERRASEIRHYQPLLIPGLLQTGDYARSLIRARRVHADGNSVEHMVRARTERLQALADPHPLLWFVMDEVVISRVIGDEKIMGGQLDHLVSLADPGAVRIQVIPTTQDHPGLCAPFRLLTLSSAQTVLYAEHMMGGETVDTADRVGEAMTLFGQLQAEALPPRASLERIREVRESL